MGLGYGGKHGMVNRSPKRMLVGREEMERLSYDSFTIKFKLLPQYGPKPFRPHEFVGQPLHTVEQEIITSLNTVSARYREFGSEVFRKKFRESSVKHKVYGARSDYIVQQNDYVETYVTFYDEGIVEESTNNLSVI